MKENQTNKCGGQVTGGRGKLARVALVVAAFWGLASGSASAQTTNQSGFTFEDPMPISGDTGNVTLDNTGNFAEFGTPVIAGQTAQSPVWFQWTATSTGPVTFDTMGSVDDQYGLVPLDTVMAVFTGNSLGNLTQLAANDDLYPQAQNNIVGQQLYNVPIFTNKLPGNPVFINVGGNGGTVGFTNTKPKSVNSILIPGTSSITLSDPNLFTISDVSPVTVTGANSFNLAKQGNNVTVYDYNVSTLVSPTAGVIADPALVTLSGASGTVLVTETNTFTLVDTNSITITGTTPNSVITILGNTPLGNITLSGTDTTNIVGTNTVVVTATFPVTFSAANPSFTVSGTTNSLVVTAPDTVVYSEINSFTVTGNGLTNLTTTATPVTIYSPNAIGIPGATAVSFASSDAITVSGTNLDGLVTLTPGDTQDWVGVPADTTVLLYGSGPTNSVRIVATNNVLGGQVSYGGGSVSYSQPFQGPSKVTFNAVAGQTYTIVVDTKNPTLSYLSGLGSFSTGNISLSWGTHPSGVIRFASEDSDITGNLFGRGGALSSTSLTYSNGVPMMLYEVSANESVENWSGTVPAANLQTTKDYTSKLWYDVPGALVTVTRVGGSSGRVQVNYSAVSITNQIPANSYGFLSNGDIPAVAGVDFVAVSGTLTFDDNESSKTIFVPILSGNTSAFNPKPNRDFLIVLTNAVLDAYEDPSVQAPRLDTTFNTMAVRILDQYLDPRGPTTLPIVNTNLWYVSGLPTNTPGAGTNFLTTTNTYYTYVATNAVFNFMKAHFRVPRDVASRFSVPVTLFVNRTGTNDQASPTVYYRVGTTYLSDVNVMDNQSFPAQGSSDYATPDPVVQGGILGATPDFNCPNGYTGSLSWGAKDFNAKQINFTIEDNGLQQFNEDIIVSIYEKDANGNPVPCGMINQATLTILSADNHPPAGSVDELYNPDFSYHLAFPIGTTPPEMSAPGADGEVYGLAVQPDNKSIIVGDFYSYDQYPRHSIVRANPDGSCDTSFNPGTGVNGAINCVALSPNYESLIGGDFTAYNGILNNHIALVNTNGQPDPSFASGLGFNGPVNAILALTNGQFLVGGSFTTYNGASANHLARINLNGTLDTSFNAGTNLNSTVYAIGVQSSGNVIVGGDFTSAGGVRGQDHLARLTTTGAFDASFNPGSGASADIFAVAVAPDDSIVVGGEFTEINGAQQNYLAHLTANGFYDSTYLNGTAFDGPVYSLTLNTNWVYSTTGNNYSANAFTNVVQTNYTVYVGGQFTMYNGTRRLSFARLNSDGSLDTTFLDTAYNQFAGLPREYYGDSVSTVQACALQVDGNVMIGGGFQLVGGGQSDDPDVRPSSIDATETNLYATYTAQGIYQPDCRSRAGVRSRSNVARLIGGATPGPGNLSLGGVPSVPKTTGTYPVTLVRTNGYLGVAGANFIVQPGLAQPGTDYSAQVLDPFYGNAWEYTTPSTRMQSDGLFGTNGYCLDSFGTNHTVGTGNDLGAVSMTIYNNPNSLANLTCNMTLANPASDQFYLGGVDIPLGVALGQSTLPLTLINNNQPAGTFGFSASTYVATNGTVVLTVNRTNGLNGNVSLQFATSSLGATATPGTDYVATNGTLSFLQGVSSRNFSVRVLNTNYITNLQKFFTVSLTGLNIQGNGSGIYSANFGQSVALVNIINPNYPGYLSLSTNYYTTNINAGAAIITVTRTVGSKGTLTVAGQTTNGTALNGVNYTGVTNTLTWVNGDASPKTFTVPILNNGSVGSGSQFGVSITSPTLNGTNNSAAWGLLAGSVTNAVVAINNNNYNGYFQFASASYLVNEDAGSLLVTVRRSGSTNGTATVQYSTSDAFAFAGTNYVGTNGTLTFVPGQLAASFTVKILDDGVVDPAPSQFYFNLNLTAVSAGGYLGNPTTAQVEIVDAQSYNSPPGSADVTFAPGTGMNGVVYALAVQSNGQILAGGNFTLVNGVPESYLARLNLDGSLDRSGFLYGLSSANAPVYALVNQEDDNVLVAGAFTNFNGTPISRIARLQHDGNLDSSFNPGSGVDNTIYALAETFINGSRYIYAGGAFSTVNGNYSPHVTRFNDNGTVDQSFSIGSGPNGTVYAVAAYPANSFYAGDVLVAGSFTNFNGVAADGVARLTVSGAVDTNFSAHVSLNGSVYALAIQADDRVLLGGAFTNVNGTSLTNIARLNVDGTVDNTFVAGVGQGINGPVNALAVQPDTRILVGGQFTLANGLNRNNITRLLPSGAPDPTINFGTGANGAVDALVVQPADENILLGGGFTTYDGATANGIARLYGSGVVGSGVFNFTAANFTVDENGTSALIGIWRSGGTAGTNADGSGNVSISFTTSNLTAVAGVNYQAISTNLVFPPGQALEYVAVPVYNPNVVTNDLRVQLNLSNPSAGTSLGDQQPAYLTILNDNTAVQFGAPVYSVAKNTGTGLAYIDVQRIGGSSGNASVNFVTTTNGTATPGVDFYPTNLTVFFTPGVTDVVVTVPIINNSLPEGNQTVVFSLTNATGTLLYSPSNSVLTIIDTVQAPGNLFFAATNYTTTSGSGTAYLTVLRTNGSYGAVSATFTTVPVTAVPGVDYQTTGGSVSFSDGQASQTIPITVLNNSLVEAPVTLSVQLSNPLGGAVLANPTNALLTIVNTNLAVGFVNATNTTVDTAGVVLVTVQRVGATNGATSVNFATADATAVHGVNYQAQSGTLTFQPGESLRSISVPVLDNTNQTVPLYFTMTVSNPSGGAKLLAQTNTTVVINPANAGLSFQTNSISVLRSSGTAVITVVCSNPGVEPVVTDTNVVPLEVTYSTADGSAVAGVDYTATTGILVFTNGIGTNTFTVPILNSGLVTSNKSFTVSLSNPTTPGVLTAPSSQTVTIVNTVSGLAFSSASYTIQKTGGSATITVNRTGYTNSIVQVAFLATNGTAQSGLNFFATNGILVFTNGVTSQTFVVPVIDTTAVQPDLTVSLQLSSPSTGGALVAPSAATLTIHDNTGSYVVPVAAWLQSSTGPDFASGIIDTNTTNTVQFSFRDSGGVPVNNLMAVLLATNGITPMASANGSPLAAWTNTYGPLVYLGHSVSRPYVFSVKGTNGQVVTPMFRLLDTNNSEVTVIGTNVFSFTLGTITTTVANTNAIVINDDTNASPYPSVINVSGLGGVLVRSAVTFSNLWHTDPSDIDALVVAPGGTNTLVMAHCGSGYAVTNTSLTFVDSASNKLASASKLVTGTNQPTQYYPVKNFP